MLLKTNLGIFVFNPMSLVYNNVSVQELLETGLLNDTHLITRNDDIPVSPLDLLLYYLLLQTSCSLALRVLLIITPLRLI